MEQWEYFPTYLESKVKDKATRRFLRDRLKTKRLQRYMPEALMPELNRLGEEGWELIHMEPVNRRSRGDILLGGRRWTNVYFCVFKRRKAGNALPVLPLRADGQPAFQAAEQPEPHPLAPKSFEEALEAVPRY